MVKTLRLSFALKNTYRVNSILYAVKQIPILKRVLPDSLYRIRGFKIFANVLTGIWELLSIFLGKFLYFLTMVCGIGLLYDKAAPEAVFLHILLFLTVIGAFTNTHLFNPTRDKYYAMILLRMDARAYTLSNYAYAMAKVVVGFLPLALLFGLQRGVAWWCCLLLPLAVAGAKLTVAAFSLWDYTRRGFAYNENKLTKYVWLAAGLLLALAYGLPALGVVLPVGVSMAAFGLLIVSGAVSIRTICTFQSYRAVNQELLAQMLQQMDSAKTAAKKTVEKSISADTSITSRRQGFAYLNELFIKRHQKILWKATEKITAVILGLVAVGLLAIRLSTEVGETLNGILLLWLPYFTFIMYKPRHRLHPGALYELRPQPADLRFLQGAEVHPGALPHPPVGDYQNQRSPGADAGRRPGAAALRLRRHGKSPGLCGAGGNDPGAERLLLHPLSDNLLPAPALQCRHRAEKRHLFPGDDGNVPGVLLFDERAPADPGLRPGVHRVLPDLLRGGLCPGLPPGAQDLPHPRITTTRPCRRTRRQGHLHII